MTSQPSSHDLIHSLGSVKCPACGGAKKCRHTFCYACYRRLPADLKSALYDQIGQGYEEAITEAMDRLGATTFILPPGDSPCRKDATAGTATKRDAAS